MTTTTKGATLTLLRAAKQLSARSPSFSAEDLVVTAWQMDKQTFGLSGFKEQYPNSNKVLVTIMGSKGLVQRGYLRREAAKLYSLTPEGIALIPTPPARKSELTKDQEKHLYQLLNSAAADWFNTGQAKQITFADALKFWNITQQSDPEQVTTRLAAVDTLLVKLAELFLSTEEIILSNGMSLTTKAVADCVRVRNSCQKI